jgi:ABC-type Fe3+-hydroxamate transport system substrate-binding protein
MPMPKAPKSPLSPLSPRIVSLVPSLTETLFALGLGAYVVGRTGFCIHPQDAVAHLPKVGGTKDVAIDKVAQLAPTHVLVNVDENNWPTVQALQQLPQAPQVVVTHPCGPQDSLALLDQIASTFPSLFDETNATKTIAVCAVNTPATCLKHLKNSIQARLERLQYMQGARPSQKVLYLIWKDPWMSVAQDTYISRLLALVGWQTWPPVQGGEAGAARYPKIGGSEPWLAQIDRVLLSSEPYRFTREHIRAAQQLCPQANVQLVNGEHLSWWGARTAQGLDYAQALAEGT